MLAGVVLVQELDRLQKTVVMNIETAETAEETMKVASDVGTLINSLNLLGGIFPVAGKLSDDSKQ